MKKKYYLRRDANRLGPFTIKELRELNIKPDDSVWYEGLYKWTEAKNIVALQRLFREELKKQNKNEKWISDYTKWIIIITVSLSLLIIGLIIYLLNS